MAQKPKSPRGIRYWLQQLHLWTGLILLLPLVAMGISGAVLVYAHDLPSLFGAARPQITAAGEWQSPAALIAAARAEAGAAGSGRVPLSVSWPVKPGEPAMVRLSRPGLAAESGASAPPRTSPFAGSVPVLLDPVTAQPVRRAAPAMSGWVRFFHDLHGHLFITGGLGRRLVGWLGIAMLALGCSGLVLWWPRQWRDGQWKAAFMVRRTARGVRLHRELHGAAGIWSLTIFMLVSFTGVYIAFPQQTAAMINAVFPGRDLRAAQLQARVAPLPGAMPIALDAAIDLARAKVPDARFLSAFLPVQPSQPLRIGLIRAGHEEGAPAITVLVDPWRHSVIDVFDPAGFSAGETIMAWQRALHEGAGLGGIYRFLVFLSGLIIPLFAVTGFFMWWIKRRNRKATERARQAALRQAAAPGSAE
ncbi:MAG TPA: PepSY-associated TM helix domain-containing protein [Ferrovibrio sp.]|uniref:PepSY-associated TM helix domain-containing protein n=1 Tax=Ferrovibrio sp. TaxID=1917215 RepID=UPI002ED65D0A